ncbi:MAG: hypothetical protein MUO92_01520 [Dehalococcoidales bacterium]|nr:hypothetical protein [Dehalococcoidales bacterium]
MEPEGTKRCALICSAIKGRIGALFHIHPTPRILLFFIAVLLKLTASMLGGIGFIWNDSAMMITGSVIWLVWFVILFLIATPQTDRLLQNQIRWLKPSALVISVNFLLAGLVLLVTLSSFGLGVFQTEGSNGKSAELLTSFENVIAYNDGTALCHQATENLIDGNNPYATANIITATIRFDNSYDQVTPLREGSFANIFPYPTMEQLEQLWQVASQNPEQIPPELESKLCYPAGCFLLPAPFILMGADDFRIIFLIYLLPALAYVVWKVPRDLRLLFIGAILISLEIWFSIAVGETGALAFPFLLLAWILTKKHLWLSALFMGVAIATKQVAWFFMPFYLILIFRTTTLKRMLAVLSIVASVFIVFNLPFIISDPKLWLTSITAPMIDDLFPMGVGIVTLVTGGALNIQSPLLFTILELFVGGLAVIWYFRNCLRYPHAGPLLAVLPLFFAWRSLWPYFFYFDIIILAAVLIDKYGSKSQEQLTQVSAMNDKTSALPSS